MGPLSLVASTFPIQAIRIGGLAVAVPLLLWPFHTDIANKKWRITIPIGILLSCAFVWLFFFMHRYDPVAPPTALVTTLPGPSAPIAKTPRKPKVKETISRVQQTSTGSHSPNIVTGDHSPVTINEPEEAPRAAIGGTDTTITNNVFRGIIPEVTPGSLRVTLSNNIVDATAWFEHLEKVRINKTKTEEALTNIRTIFEHNWQTLPKEKRDENEKVLRAFEVEARKQQTDDTQLNCLFDQLKAATPKQPSSVPCTQDCQK